MVLMKKPPYLSPKQREIIPFLITGCSHSEIAVDLGMTERAVRQETRDVLGQFNTQSIKAAMEELIEYQRYYGMPHGRHHIYVEKTHSKLSHGATPHSVVVTRAQRDFVVHGDLNEVSYRMFIDADIRSHTFNGAPTLPSREHMGDRHYTVVIDPEIEAGQAHDQHVMFELHDVFREGQPQFHINFLNPAAEFAFDMEFHPSRPARDVWVTAEQDLKPMEMSQGRFSDDGLNFTFHMNEPNIGLKLFFMWNWIE